MIYPRFIDYKLALLFAGDHVPEGVRIDASFLVSETSEGDGVSGNDREVILAGASCPGTILLLGDGRPVSSYGGAERYLRELQKINPNVEHELVPGYPYLDYSDPDRVKGNTWTEALSVVDHCKEKGYRNLLVISPHYHAPRVGRSMVSAALLLWPVLNVFIRAVTQDWGELARVNQGAERDIRHRFIDSECERNILYTQSAQNPAGNLAPAEDILEYLLRRYECAR